MELVLTNKITFKINEDVVDEFDNFKDAMDGGAVEITKTDIHLINEQGMVCEDKEMIDTIIQAVVYGLRERT